ncbi:WhiB family transcriptional regulator [Mycobacteroides abscessus]|uniref:WhiB family transcriptional regulator n=1 Tax=Mycobacteroides abscessus TaxID=36809 RepID=UPI001F38C8A1|nr:WhiB family transcriptional regulator [Mycobacteroides abscessus]
MEVLTSASSAGAPLVSRTDQLPLFPELEDRVAAAQQDEPELLLLPPSQASVVCLDAEVSIRPGEVIHLPPILTDEARQRREQHEKAQRAAEALGELIWAAQHDGRDTKNWEDLAECRYIDPEVWFPEKGGSAARAKRICASCPVRIECLDQAISNDERFGVWGGKDYAERKAIKKERERRVS